MEQSQLPRITTRHGSIKTWATAATFLAAATSVLACSGVGPPGVPVVFGDQTNIIIWDEVHQTEHFIRNANFRSGATSFGFIAPTPGKPDLHEASNQAFYTLASLAPVRAFAGAGGFGGGATLQNKEAEVKVIQEADVAGFHATTLWSTDAHAINDWMNTHGYVSTPEVEKWAERYTGRGWYLTAFKVIDKNKVAASTGTIRMTFHTQKPFNPFYVPSTNIQANRNGTLRVYFVSVGDYDANIGDTETWQVPLWTAPIPTTSAEKLAEQIDLPDNAIPEKSQVETFVDYNFPRPAPDDIYFARKKLVPPDPAVPISPVRSNVPFMVLPVAAACGLLGLAIRRR